MASAERDWERRIGGRLKASRSSYSCEGGRVGQHGESGHTPPACLSRRCRKRLQILRQPFACACWTAPHAELSRRSTLSHCLRRERIVFDELQQGIKEIEFLLNPEAGEVRLGTSEILAAGLVPQVIDRLLRRHPKIFVRVSLIDTATVEFRELRDRNVDLLLARVPETLIDDDINIEVFFDDPAFCCRRCEQSMGQASQCPFGRAR